MLVEVDVYTPGAAAQSFAGDFLREIQAARLRVDRIVPLHGMGPVPFAQLVQEAAPTAATN
jgi:hypothetical protein